MSLAERVEGFTNVTGCVVAFPDRDSPEGAALRARLTICRLCDGEAIIQSANPGEAWAWCPQCGGTGMALDGAWEAHPAKYEEWLTKFSRLCETGFPMGDRSTRRESGALDEQELSELRARLSTCLPARALLLPAVRNVDASFVAIGPTSQKIIDEFWRPRTACAGEMLRVRGFIDLESGSFLDSATAMVRARTLGLLESKAMMLGADELFYKDLVPMLVVRGAI